MWEVSGQSNASTATKVNAGLSTKDVRDLQIAKGGPAAPALSRRAGASRTADLGRRGPSVRVRARLALARCAKRHAAGTLDSRVGAHGSRSRNHAETQASRRVSRSPCVGRARTPRGSPRSSCTRSALVLSTGSAAARSSLAGGSATAQEVAFVHYAAVILWTPTSRIVPEASSSTGSVVCALLSRGTWPISCACESAAALSEITTAEVLAGARRDADGHEGRVAFTVSRVSRRTRSERASSGSWPSRAASPPAPAPRADRARPCR